MNPDASVTFQVWFAKSCKGHEGAVDAVFQTYKKHSNRVSVIGIFGVVSSSDRENAQAMGWLGRKDEISINKKTEFVLDDANGMRRVSFKGFEGRDYSLDDFRQVIHRLIAKTGA